MARGARAHPPYLASNLSSLSKLPALSDAKLEAMVDVAPPGAMLEVRVYAHFSHTSRSPTVRHL